MASILVITFTLSVTIVFGSSATVTTHNVTESHGNSTHPEIFSNCDHAPENIVICCRTHSLVPLYVYYNWELKDHYYTTDYALFGVGKKGYKMVGIEFNIWKSPTTDTLPVYGYYNTKTKKHLYTFEWFKHNKSDFAFESILGYIYPKPQTGLLPIYHFEEHDNGDNIYTADLALEPHAGISYEFNGILAYACKFSGSF